MAQIATFPKIELSQVFAWLVVVLGAVGALKVLLIPSSFRVEKPFTRFLALLFLVCGVLEISTNIFHLRGRLCEVADCSIGTGAYLSVLGALLWIIAATLALFLPTSTTTIEFFEMYSPGSDSFSSDGSDDGGDGRPSPEDDKELEAGLINILIEREVNLHGEVLKTKVTKQFADRSSHVEFFDKDGNPIDETEPTPPRDEKEPTPEDGDDSDLDEARLLELELKKARQPLSDDELMEMFELRERLGRPNPDDDDDDDYDVLVVD
eukprot:CAMPEP_0116548630 /NCGR_PEP_ID=MMETSP0397-20121206/4442_1 /TAXON_ID=216820 /ORGANISM="Cyclophora tenuis, Strain ECT3854" /LENGTH=264 /DNA_ID=CAMNT_0004073299 /DNA_START=382 /DNA_END=1176 /DNA_ORIENTATION=+